MQAYSDDQRMSADELKQQLTEIENRNRAGVQAEADLCPPQFSEEWKPAIAKAMNLLLYRPRTEKELKERLERNGFEPEAVRAALQYVSYYGYLNDWKYAENYVLSNGNRKSRGILRAELTGKGIGEAAIEAALELLETDEEELAEALLIKRYGEPHSFDEKELRRAVGFLGRKGFASSLVWSVIRDYQRAD